MKMTRAQLAKTLENPALSLEGPSDTFLRQVPTLLEGERSKCVKTAPGAWGTGPFNMENPEYCTSPRSEDEPTAKFALHHTTDEAKLNKTERAYLAHLRMLGYKEIGIQDIQLKIGDDCRLLCDFNFIDENGQFRFVDTKAYNKKTQRPLVEDDAVVKMKVAARKYRWAKFSYAYQVNGQWTEQEVKP